MSYAKIFGVSVVAVGLLVGAGSTSRAFAAQTTASGSVVADDSALHARIETAIEKDATLNDQNIDVDVKNHIVTLTGAVQTSTRKAHVGRLANIAGVTRVDNQLRVDAKDGKSMSAKVGDATKTAVKETGKAVKTAGAKTKDVAVATGEKTKDVAVATGDNVTDAYLTTSLNAKFVDEATLKGSNINVDTNNHVVTLKGTVMSAAGKARAEEIARTTTGVHRVMNHLVIGPKKS